MQTGGIGNSDLNHNNVHYVTPGLNHRHETIGKKTGGLSASSFLPDGSGGQSGQGTVGETSLLDMLRSAVDGGKRLFGHIWGADGQTGEAVTKGGDAADTLLRDASHFSQTASASVVPHHSQINNNPYFTLHSDPGVIKPNVFGRIKVRLRDMTGQLTKRFGDRFQGLFPGRNALNSKRQKPKEDLRKRSRYKAGAEEIDCILTDETYLMDSYDSRGEYSRLTTENRR